MRIRRRSPRRNAGAEVGRLRFGAEKGMRTHYRPGVGPLHLAQRLHLYGGNVRKDLPAVQMRHEMRQYFSHGPGGDAQENGIRTGQGLGESLIGQRQIQPRHRMPRRAPACGQQSPHPAPAADDDQTPGRKTTFSRVAAHTRTCPQHSQKFGNDLLTQDGSSSVRRPPRSSSRAKLMAIR